MTYLALLNMFLAGVNFIEFMFLGTWYNLAAMSLNLFIAFFIAHKETRNG
jgi:hypothetical protein